MENLPPLSAFTASIIGLVASAAIYLGAQGKTLTHRLTVTAGVIVILCISVLPFYLLMAFDNLNSPNYEPVFVAYISVSAASAVAAGIGTVLLWVRRINRPNLAFKRDSPRSGRAP
jgi:hypothetical protein